LGHYWDTTDKRILDKSLILLARPTGPPAPNLLNTLDCPTGADPPFKQKGFPPYCPTTRQKQEAPPQEETAPRLSSGHSILQEIGVRRALV
jgi:hypothetical protein